MKNINSIKKYLLFIIGLFLLLLIINILEYSGLLDDIPDVYISWLAAYFLFSAAYFSSVNKMGIMIAAGFVIMGTASFADGFEEFKFIAEDGLIDNLEDLMSDYFDLAGVMLISLGFLKNISGKNRSIDTLKHSSLHDPLTGVYNRRALYQIFGTKEITEPVTFCYIDLDGFKEVNDSLGHDAGDTILEEFSEIITRYKRGNDQFFRIGGDEFLLVVDTLELEVVGNIIERLHVIVKKEMSEYLLDFTCGYVPVSGNVTLDEILKEADSVMYQKKHEKKK